MASEADISRPRERLIEEGRRLEGVARDLSEPYAAPGICRMWCRTCNS